MVLLVHLSSQLCLLGKCRKPTKSSGRLMKPKTQSHLCHLPPQIHLRRNSINTRKHSLILNTFWSASLSSSNGLKRIIQPQNDTHLIFDTYPQIWSILVYPSGAASSNMVYLIIFDHQHHHWNHYHGSDTINGHPSGAASSKMVYLMISSGAITPGTARYLSAEWSCIACIDVLFAKLFVVQRRIGPQLVNG